MVGRPDPRSPIDLRIAELRATIAALPAGDPTLPDQITALALALQDLDRTYDWFDTTEPDLHEAIALLRQALSLTSDSDPKRLVRTSELATALLKRDPCMWDDDSFIGYSGTDTPADYNEALVLLHRVVSETDPTDAVLPERLGDLARMVDDRYRRYVAPADLDELIELRRTIIAVTSPDDLARHNHLDELANALRKRFTEQQGLRADLDEAIELWRTALTVVAVGDREAWGLTPEVWTRGVINYAASASVAENSSS